MNNLEEINTDVVIIGAGLTGLTTAYYLNKKKKKFIVLEKENRIGGVIKSKSKNNFLFEEGPNTGVIGNTTVVELFEELSKTSELELAGSNVKKRFILKNNKWEHLPMGLIDAIKTPLFSTKDKFRVLGEPFRSVGKNPHENLASFVKRRLGDSFFNYAIDPFIIGVYAGDPNYLIPKYALPKLYNLEQKYGSLIGGTIKKSFIKKTAIEKRVSRKVFSFKDGLSSLTNALFKSAGVDNFYLNSNNIIVSPVDNIYVVSYINEKNETITIKTKNVITTVGAFALEPTLPFIEKSEINKINSLLYTKVVELAIGFNKWNGIELDGFGGLIPSIEKRDLLGILYMSSLFKNRMPENGALFSIFIGGVRRQDLVSLTDKEISKLVEKECIELLKIKNFNPDLFEIIRHDKAIPQYGIESGERFETIIKLEKKHKGLFIGGNLKDGIGMADRIKQGKELAFAV